MSDRIVVDLVGDRTHGLVAESRFVERAFLPGGEHNMYELAFAAAALGQDVELRGWLDRDTFRRFAEAVGAAPRTDLPARPPEPSDVIVVPEGWRDPLDYARLLLSPGRLAIFLLAPPGLFGWPFVGPGWSRPDPATVAVDAVATPAHFRAMHELGISLLTHSPGLAEAVVASGVPCAFVGVGRPETTIPRYDGDRSTDVAALMSNRWAPLVRQVTPELSDLRVDLIEEAPNAEVVARLARSRVLLWPSRIEGHATIPWEARTVGCVPVALSTNRFAVGLTAESGSVVVDDVEGLAPAVRALLADPARWSELSERATRASRAEVDWKAYLGRVRGWLEEIPEGGPAREARAGMGAALGQWLSERAAANQAALEELSAELERVREDRGRIHADLAEASARLDGLYRKRGVRATLRLESEWRRLKS